MELLGMDNGKILQSIPLRHFSFNKYKYDPKFIKMLRDISDKKKKKIKNHSLELHLSLT